MNQAVALMDERVAQPSWVGIALDAQRNVPVYGIRMSPLIFFNQGTFLVN